MLHVRGFNGNAANSLLPNCIVVLLLHFGSGVVEVEKNSTLQEASLTLLGDDLRAVKHFNVIQPLVLGFLAELAKPAQQQTVILILAVTSSLTNNLFQVKSLKFKHYFHSIYFSLSLWTAAD